MRKTVIFTILVLLFAAETLAGDLPEAVITLWDSDVFIGEITEIKDGRVTIAVNSALFKNYDVGEITLDEFEYMTFDEKNKRPDVGDYLAAAVIFTDGRWQIAFSEENASLIAKSDGLDPETLTLYSGGSDFIKRMNSYINDGTYSYERRQEIRKKINGAQKTEDVTDLTANTEELDPENKKLAAETKIVVPPPAANTAVKNGNNFLRYSLTHYGLIIIISAVFGFVSAKRWKNK